MPSKVACESADTRPYNQHLNEILVSVLRAMRSTRYTVQINILRAKGKMNLQYWKNNISGLLVVGGFLIAVTLFTSVIPSVDLLSSDSSIFGVIFTYLTYSAGKQGFLITLAALVVAIAIKTPNRKRLLMLMVQLGVLLVLSFGAKSLLKKVTQSPRPYTEALTQLHLVDSPQDFYHLDTPDQNAVIAQASQSVSHWRTIHWQGETDYSFPSGHTVFVALCLFFFGGLFVQRKQYLALSVLFVWALGVAYSRLWLGMHRPEDLMGSALVVGIIAMFIPAPSSRLP
ncbi:phosphatase PAP2 family protein [Vibrio ezurae]|nr:phosphatase PAP2 family protein [Vibrio ezurae]